MKRSVLRRMSSTPIPEFEVENLKIDEPDTTEGKTGDIFIYTIHHIQLGPDGSDQVDFVISGPTRTEPIIEEHPKFINTINVSIVPLQQGEYQLNLFHRNVNFFNGKILSITGKQIVPEKVIKNVKIIGFHSTKGYTNQINEFSIDATLCPRIGGVKLHIKSLTPRTAAKLYLTDHQNGVYTVGYKPTLAGEFLLSIQMGGIDVPGTPLKIVCFD